MHTLAGSASVLWLQRRPTTAAGTWKGFAYCRSTGTGGSVSIGIINENRVLKNWYIEYRFAETGTRKSSHLPFEVCFLEKEVQA